MDALSELDRLSREATREELPALLGRVVAVEARLRLRLSEPSPAAVPPPSRPLDAVEAAAIAGVSKRWLLAHTRGQKFREDKSRKVVKFDEVGLRQWLAGPRR